ncbi:MAG: DUF503 domain-containing protein [Polyangiaceae bacterium]
MFIGVCRLVIQIPEARSLKDRRRVVKSLKDRVRAKLPVSIAEVGDLEHPGVAYLGLAVVANESGRCSEILSAAVSMARVVPDGILADVRTEIVSFGSGGKGIEHGIEGSLFTGLADPGPRAAGGDAYGDLDEDER